MSLEEQISELTGKVEELSDKVARLEREEKWVSAKELAEIMGCSVNNVYIRIRSGEIYASRKLGSPKIPLSQFYENREPDPEPIKRSIKDRIFKEDN